MQTEYVRRHSLCLLKETEVTAFVQELKKEHPQVEFALFERPGTLQIMLQSDTPLDSVSLKIEKRFPTFFYEAPSIEEALHNELIKRKKTLALAESCTGGAMAAKLTAMPEASKYLLGSLVAYSNAWKERFLQVSRTTLETHGAVSRECVIEMVKGLLSETEADFGVAISGVAGPGGGSLEKPVGTIYIAIGERGKQIDAGLIHASKDRVQAINDSLHIALGALWRRVVHNTVSIS